MPNDFMAQVANEFGGARTAQAHPTEAPTMVVGTPPTPGQPAPAPPPTPAPAMAPAGPPPAPTAPQPRYLPAGGGPRRVAARETDMRGPTLQGAQGSYYDAIAEATRAANDHTQSTAATDYAQALTQERRARIREEAADQSTSERAEDLEQRRMDFDNSVRAMSQNQMQPDGGYWAKRTTPQKIGSVISLMLGGFISGARGGPNPAQVAIDREIDREVHAQETNYKIDSDRTAATRTAYGLAMNKYKNEDAARSFARAAAIDTVQAQIRKQAALWKSAQAQSSAELAMADLEGRKMQHIQAGVQFRPEHVVARQRQWVDRETGVRYGEGDMRKMLAKKQDDLSKAHLKRMELSGKVGEQDKLDRQEATGISDKLTVAGVPQARSAAEQALRALNKSGGSGAEELARHVPGASGLINRASPDSRVREQAYANFENAFMKAIAGNVTKEEEDRIRKGLGSAFDPASRQNAIKMAMEQLSDIEKNVKSRGSARAQKIFEDRREEAKGGPRTAPAGATKAAW